MGCRVGVGVGVSLGTGVGLGLAVGGTAVWLGAGRKAVAVGSLICATTTSCPALPAGVLQALKRRIASSPAANRRSVRTGLDSPVMDTFRELL